MPLTLAQLEALSQQTFPTRAVSRRDDDGYAALHAAIGAAIEPVARALDFDMSSFVARDQQELLALPPHILFVWCDEAELMASFYALPEADITANVAQALHAVAGLSFGDPSQLPPEQRGAALRLMAAIGTPLARDPDDFFAAYVEGGAHDPEAAGPRRDRGAVRPVRPLLRPRRRRPRPPLLARHHRLPPRRRLSSQRRDRPERTTPEPRPSSCPSERSSHESVRRLPRPPRRASSPASTAGALADAAAATLARKAPHPPRHHIVANSACSEHARTDSDGVGCRLR